ncbi:uncharacterized protein LOC126794398 [Argentina anserina]|uniref:uncharacterized protein LOC126794398 n=1 Tax=Argentina anserina TaxID=57926 RepID=UPI00217643F8|nr:uncharacterized protein LOC126794398 [Potentilla anserina]
MQGGRGGGGRGGRGPFDFNDPFANFGGFGGGFGGQGSLMPGFFGGRDPFDDPFFTRPFGGMFESGFPGMFPGMFPDMNGGLFPRMGPAGFIGNQAQAPEPRSSRAPVIEELDSDDGEEEGSNEKKENPRKRGGPSNDPYVEHPDDDDDDDDDDAVEEKKRSKHLGFRGNFDQFGAMQPRPQGHSYTFQSSSVTYGGANGAYYTSSKTSRMGSDGVAFEESKEADTSSGKATHRVSKGLHNKGHSVTRKLADGQVDTMQTLHNLNEDELSGFEQAWKGAAQKHMPRLHDQIASYDNLGDSGSRHGQANRGGWALPSNEFVQNSGNMIGDTQGRELPYQLQQSGNKTVGGGDGNNSSRGRAEDQN